jgi:predicted nucleic acid-binding protein
MSVVVDASVVVAALIDSGPLGEWAEGVLTSDTVLAPHLMPAEVSNILRRAGVAGDIPADAATLAHVDLGDLAAELFAYEPLAQRIWDLRHNLTAYDAWYVALAEQVGAELATLDRRLARAPGPTCGFLLPP